MGARWMAVVLQRTSGTIRGNGSSLRDELNASYTVRLMETTKRDAREPYRNNTERNHSVDPVHEADTGEPVLRPGEAHEHGQFVV